jgi:hypothetical protein
MQDIPNLLTQIDSLLGQAEAKLKELEGNLPGQPEKEAYGVRLERLKTLKTQLLEKQTTYLRFLAEIFLETDVAAHMVTFRVRGIEISFSWDDSVLLMTYANTRKLFEKWVETIASDGRFNQLCDEILERLGEHFDRESARIGNDVNYLQRVRAQFEKVIGPPKRPRAKN